MIFAGAVRLAERVIELSSEGQFTEKIADGGLIEHSYFATETQSRRDFLFSPCLSLTQCLLYLFDFPIKARADGTLTDFGPLGARRAGNIHVE